MVLSNRKILFGGFVLLEAILFIALITSLFSFAVAGIGQNVTVITLLEVGNVFPEVLSVRVNEGNSIDLVANQSRMVSCVGVVRDYNGENDINSTSAVFFDQIATTVGASDDNNNHYTNSSCRINTTFFSYNGYTDDAYSALANCTFQVYYYANPQVWNCTLTANDTYQWQDTNSTNQTVNQLLSLLLPSTINYGTVNATFVSDEQIANVTNVGNVRVNLSLEGYGFTQGDNWSLNCTTGNVQNISVHYEKYNLSASTAGSLTLSTFEGNYTNLTSTATVKTFRLGYRQNDTVQFIDDTNASYWRVYVPRGVAGNCTGNIIFGATTATGS